MLDDTIKPHQKTSQKPNGKGLGCFIFSCLSLLLIWISLFTLIVYGIFTANTNIFSFSRFTNGLKDNEFVSSLFAFDKDQKPFTVPNNDYSNKSFYSLFASSRHSLSLYYPHTHSVTDEEYSLSLKTYDDGIDSNFSNIELKIINLSKLYELYKNPLSFTGAVISTEIENTLLNNFTGYEEVIPTYKRKANIHSKEYDIKSYRTKAYYEYDSQLVKGCKSKTKYNLDTIFLNYNFYVVIGHYTGFVCDPLTGKATKTKIFDTNEMNLTYSILDSLKFSDNQSEITQYENKNNYEYYKNKITELSSILGINIYFDAYPENLRKQLIEYKWDKTDLEGSFDKYVSPNTLELLYRELDKYPKDLIKASKIKFIVLVQNLEETAKRDVTGLAVWDQNTVIYDLSNIDNNQDFSSTIHHEMMHLIDAYNFYEKVLYQDSFWVDYNLSGEYAGFEKAKEDEYLYATNNYTIYGYATGYAKVELFEDRAETFRFLMNAPDFKHARNKRLNEPQFDKKIALMQKQISTLSPKMNNAYFLELRYGQPQ